jgi:hypothetical protein
VKTILPLSFFLVSSFSFSQSRETFDLLAYTPPQGWEKEKGSGVLAYTQKTQATYCRIILYESATGTGNSQQDFRNEWESLIIKTYKPEHAAEQVQEQHASEWNINAGTSTFTFEDAQGIVMLTTMSDARTVISLVFIFNDESYLSDIEKFMQSIEIVRPPQSMTQNVTQGTETIVMENKPRLNGRWGKSSSIMAEGTNLGMAGYSKSVYDFKSDGTYTYKERTFSYGVQAILIVRESGVYSVSGNSLTVKPSSSVIESYEKKGGIDELDSRYVPLYIPLFRRPE